MTPELRTFRCLPCSHQAHALISPTRPCGHHELAYPLCGCCFVERFGVTDMAVDPTVLTWTAKVATPCERCGECAPITAMMLAHFAIETPDEEPLTPLCWMLGDLPVEMCTTFGKVEHPSRFIALTQAKTGDRRRVTCPPCREALHS